MSKKMTVKEWIQHIIISLFMILTLPIVWLTALFMIDLKEANEFVKLTFKAIFFIDD